MVQHAMSSVSSVGCVVIGRNEGMRFRSCVASLLNNQFVNIVYVDSGSTDGSVEFAENAGLIVERLDSAAPFTAARARNAGFSRLMSMPNKPELVQFIDGDCVLLPDWIGCARSFLNENEGYAAACGRRKERYPEATIYNRLCDLEWNTPVGDALAFGGDVLIRADHFEAVGGFRSDLISGEEPELCVRLRSNGLRIRRLDKDMTLHDANIERFSQWWMRCVRGGYGFARVAALHWGKKTAIWQREVARATLYGGLIPTAAIVGMVVHPASLLLLLVYPLLLVRIYAGSRVTRQWRGPYAMFMVLSKFAEFQGIMKYVWDFVVGRRSAIIEYK